MLNKNKNSYSIMCLALNRLTGQTRLFGGLKKRWLGKLCLIGLVWLIQNCALYVPVYAVHVSNKASLQRGAKIFMNYCSGCHSLKYLRYSRMAEDLGLTSFDGRIDEGLLKNNLIFTEATINDPIRIALPPDDAKHWFGVVPPDLSLVAREKGSAWLFSYLNSFYNDNSRPFGVNNQLVPNVAMPNVLETFQGQRVLLPTNHLSALGGQIKEDEVSDAQYEIMLEDLINFLVYVGEPAQRVRYQLGFIVISFLLILLLVAIGLNRAYWRKIP